MIEHDAIVRYRHRVPAGAVPRACCFALLVCLAGCALWPPGRDAEVAGPQRSPLPRAEELLDRDLGRSEADVDAGYAVNTNRLAHLRMTRAALDQIEAGDDQRAFDLLERAIAIDGRTGFAYLYLGYVHLRHGQADQASVFLDRASALLPADERLAAEVAALRTEAMSEFVGPEIVR